MTLTTLDLPITLPTNSSHLLNEQTSNPFSAGFVDHFKPATTSNAFSSPSHQLSIWSNNTATNDFQISLYMQRIQALEEMITRLRLENATIESARAAIEKAYNTLVSQLNHIPNPTTASDTGPSNTVNVTVEAPVKQDLHSPQPLPVLDSATYPNVRFWTAQKWKAWKETAQGQLCSSTTSYLEDNLGKPLDTSKITSIGNAMRDIWHDFRRAGIIDSNTTWKTILSTAKNVFRSEIAQKYPELILCDDAWKLDKFAKQLYSSYKQTWITNKANDNGGTSSSSGKRKLKTESDANNTVDRRKRAKSESLDPSFVQTISATKPAFKPDDPDYARINIDMDLDLDPAMNLPSEVFTVSSPYASPSASSTSIQASFTSIPAPTMTTISATITTPAPAITATPEAVLAPAIIPVLTAAPSPTTAPASVSAVLAPMATQTPFSTIVTSTTTPAPSPAVTRTTTDRNVSHSPATMSTPDTAMHILPVMKTTETTSTINKVDTNTAPDDSLTQTLTNVIGEEKTNKSESVAIKNPLSRGRHHHLANKDIIITNDSNTVSGATDDGLTKKSAGPWRPASAKSGRNLCAHRWLKQIKSDGSRDEFNAYYDKLTAEAKARYKDEAAKLITDGIWTKGTADIIAKIAILPMH